MKKIFGLLSFVAAAVLTLSSCSNKDEGAIVKISTNKGDIVVKLYDQTPQHTKNFLELANKEYFNGTIFHRVIKEFMIQGGDPDSKNPEPMKLYGNGGPDYTIPAEFVDTIYHKKGVIAMAREGDDVNPDKNSSGSQFYIVVGKVFTNEELDLLENRYNTKSFSQLQSELITNETERLLDAGKKVDYSKVSLSVQDTLKKIWDAYPKFKFSNKQRDIYTTIGGTPHLDGNYTVFGEVVEGLEVVEAISNVETDSFDRPVKDIIMKVKIVNKGNYDLQ